MNRELRSRPTACVRLGEIRGPTEMVEFHGRSIFVEIAASRSIADRSANWKWTDRWMAKNWRLDATVVGRAHDVRISGAGCEADTQRDASHCRL